MYQSMQRTPRQFAVAAGRHDLALETAGDDRAAEDDHLRAVLGERLERPRGGIVRHGRRVLDHVGDVPVDAADAAAVGGAVEADQVLEPGHRFAVVGDDRESMAEVRGVVHRGLERADDRDVD